MAKAKKCDICGSLYEVYNTRNDSKNVNGFMLLNIDADGRYYKHDIIDCCPECIVSITSHINSLYKEVKKK